MQVTGGVYAGLVVDEVVVVVIILYIVSVLVRPILSSVAYLLRSRNSS